MTTNLTGEQHYVLRTSTQSNLKNKCSINRHNNKKPYKQSDQAEITAVAVYHIAEIGHDVGPPPFCISKLVVSGSRKPSLAPLLLYGGAAEAGTDGKGLERLKSVIPFSAEDADCTASRPGVCILDVSLVTLVHGTLLS